MQRRSGVSVLGPITALLFGAALPAVGQERPGEADRAFIDFMVPHHESAIMMAEDAIENANHPELKAFAERARESQRREIAQMKEWRAQWFGSEDTPPPMPMPRIPPGPEYDRIWIEHMIVHHQSATDVGTLARHAQVMNRVRRLAERIVETQTREHRQLREWLQEWY